MYACVRLVGPGPAGAASPCEAWSGAGVGYKPPGVLTCSLRLQEVTMFRKLFVVAVVAVGAVAVQKKIRDQRAEQELWAEATDDVRSPVPGRPLSE